MNDVEKVERKLLELVKIQLQLIENLYKDVHTHIDALSTSSNGLKVIKNVPRLKMNVNGSRQKTVIQLKSQIKTHQQIINAKYGPNQTK